MLEGNTVNYKGKQYLIIDVFDDEVVLSDLDTLRTRSIDIDEILNNTIFVDIDEISEAEMEM